MNVIEQLIRVIAPHICLGCGVEQDALLCAGCVESLPRVPSRCYRCKTVTDANAVCIACKRTTPLGAVHAVTCYDGLAKELVHRMKYERARQGATEIAKLLKGVFPHHADIVMTYVPTATSRVRSRGYDHAALMATYTADSDVPVQRLLSRIGQAHQVGANRTLRLGQLKGAFRAVHKDVIQGKTILLIDDVLTTGATLESAARVLKQAGAKRVEAVVFAQA